MPMYLGIKNLKRETRKRKHFKDDDPEHTCVSFKTLLASREGGSFPSHWLQTLTAASVYLHLSSLQKLAKD
jgi:hypothetical protein